MLLSLILKYYKQLLVSVILVIFSLYLQNVLQENKSLKNAVKQNEILIKEQSHKINSLTTQILINDNVVSKLNESLSAISSSYNLSLQDLKNEKNKNRINTSNTITSEWLRYVSATVNPNYTTMPFIESSSGINEKTNTPDPTSIAIWLDTQLKNCQDNYTHQTALLDWIESTAINNKIND